MVHTVAGAVSFKEFITALSTFDSDRGIQTAYSGYVRALFRPCLVRADSLVASGSVGTHGVRVHRHGWQGAIHKVRSWVIGTVAARI